MASKSPKSSEASEFGEWADKNRGFLTEFDYVNSRLVKEDMRLFGVLYRDSRVVYSYQEARKGQPRYRNLLKLQEYGLARDRNGYFEITEKGKSFHKYTVIAQIQRKQYEQRLKDRNESEF